MTLNTVDPTVAFLADSTLGPSGRFLTMGLPPNYKSLATNYKDTAVADWDTSTIATITAVDKPVILADNGMVSPVRFNVYAAWTEGTGELVIARSVSRAEEWQDVSGIGLNEPQRFPWGAHVQTGRFGNIYAIWGRYSRSPHMGGIAGSHGFSELLSHQFFTFAPESVLITVHDTNGLYVGSASSYPSMAVDTSSPLGDSLYVVWSDRVDGSRSDILLMKGYRSFAGSAVVWNTTNLLRVNVNSTAIRFWPWISWDACTGMLAVVFMENPSQGVFVAKAAVSEDHGTTWTEFQVSDVPWDGTEAAGYDYIGLATADGRAYPAWSDNRDSLGTNQARPYVSPFLLWGIVSDSVGVADNQNGTMTVTADWTTNLSAFLADSLSLTSPSGSQYATAPCSSCADVDGKIHTVALTVPCEPGTWRYTMSSRRAGCLQNRTSDIDSFFVRPSLALAGSWPGGPGYAHGCPAGDASVYTVDLGFLGSCVDTVAAGRLTLEALPVNQPNVAFFPQGVPQPADSAATPGNGYATTITERQVGGCSADSADVFLDGTSVGRVAVELLPNLDLNGDGNVDASDLSIFGPSFGTCEGDPSYNICVNFAGQDSCVDSSELSALVFHLGHSAGNPQFKSGGPTSTRLRLEPGSPAGTARVVVRLEGLQGRSTAGLVLRPAAGRIAFASWTPHQESGGTIFAADTVDVHGPRLAVLAFDLQPDASGNAELGTLSFQTSAQDVSLADLAIEFEDVAAGGAGIASEGRGLQESETIPAVTTLYQNSPNPFNPRTELRYRLEAQASVHLAIFDIAGRQIRVLVNERQQAGEHAVTWDGHDETGTRWAPDCTCTA